MLAVLRDKIFREEPRIESRNAVQLEPILTIWRPELDLNPSCFHLVDRNEHQISIRQPDPSEPEIDNLSEYLRQHIS